MSNKDLFPYAVSIWDMIVLFFSLLLLLFIFLISSPIILPIYIIYKIMRKL